MKNFFKKLAFVMALAMVITSLAPAAGVFAASAPKLNAKSATLLLGNKKRNSFDFNLANKVKGSTYKWTTSNKKVATVAQNGLVKAVSNGTATIKLAIKLPTGKTTTLSATVTVKTNATSVEITNLPEGAIKVGEKHNFNRSYTTLPGTKTTDVTKFVITSENADKATINANGFFTATEAGEYTIKAIMAQSNSKYAAGTYTAESKEVKVTVKGSISAKQTDLNTFALTFDTPVEKVAENVKVYSVIGTTKVVQSVQKVEVKDKVATIKLYVPFTPGTTYVVEYPEMEATEFVAAKTDAEDVVSLQVATTQVVVGEGKKLEVKLLNKDGVDITKAGSLADRVTFESSSDKVFLAGDTLTIFTKGEATTITATFHSYKYNATTGAEEGNVVGSGVVVGVDAASVNVGGITSWTIAKGNADWDKLNTKIAAEDPGYSLFVKVKKSDDSYIFSGTGNDEKITFESSNESVLMAYSNGDLTPIKAGSAVVIVKYGEQVIDTVNVTVSPKRAATVITFDAYQFSLSSSLQITDQKVIKVKVVDQLGDTVVLKDTNVEKLAGSPGSDIASQVVGDEVTFTGKGADAGTYTYKITSNGLSRVVTVTVKAPTKDQTTPTSYVLSLDKAVVDTSIKKGDSTREVSINVFGLANNGVKLTDETTNSKFVVKVTNPSGVTKEITNAKFEAVSISGGNLYVKAEKGNYKVTLFELVTKDGKTTEVPKGSEYFKVEDNQVAPVLVEVKKVETNAVTLEAAVRDSFKVTLNGVDVSDELTIDAAKDVLGTGSKVYIKNVRYSQEIETGVYIEHVIKVERNLTYNK